MSSNTIKRTSNRDCRSYVKSLTPFNTSSKPHAKNGTIFARWTTPDTYVVYSYGTHWPLHICVVSPDGTRHWFHNEDKHSRTTSKHYGQAHPLVDGGSRQPLSMMEQIAQSTFIDLVSIRLLGAPLRATA